MLLGKANKGLGNVVPLTPVAPPGATWPHTPSLPLATLNLRFLKWTSFSYLRPSYIFLGLKSFPPFTWLVFQASFRSQFGYYQFWEDFPDLLSSN